MNGIKYYNDTQTQLLFKKKTKKKKSIFYIVQFGNCTSSIIFHAVRLLSLEQCTSKARSSSCLRVLKNKYNKIRWLKRIPVKIKCTSFIFYTVLPWSHIPTLYQNPPLIQHRTILRFWANYKYSDKNITLNHQILQKPESLNTKNMVREDDISIPTKTKRN